MHRTQIYLEDAQYEMLRARARREGRTLAAVIRGIPISSWFASNWFGFMRIGRSLIRPGSTVMPRQAGLAELVIGHQS